MKELNIGRILIEMRKKKGVTQEEVAEYTGVSKASVSKWENGLSYPDITLLPHLATYFNISIDELLGYQPQLSEDKVWEKYGEFSAKFAEQPFLSVIEEVRQFIRKYDSCYPLLFAMAQLYLNNFILAVSREEQDVILNEGVKLLQRIQEESDDTLLKKDAMSMEAMYCIIQKKPERVFELLGYKAGPRIPQEQFIITAYQMLGESDRAMEMLQVVLYQILLELMDNLSCYFQLADRDEAKEECLKRMCGLEEAFELDRLLPHKMVGVYLAGASYYALHQRDADAIGQLKRIVRLAQKELSNFSIHGDAFLDRFEGAMKGFGITGKLPRDWRLVKKDLFCSIAENPVFEPMKGNPEFKRLVRQLERALESDS